MKNLRAIGHFGGWLVALVALGAGACGGGSPAAKPDTGVQDVAADQQQATDVPPGTDVAPDGGVEDAAVTDDAADGPVDAGSGIDCAPGPTGGPKPAGTAPQQAAGPTVATSATRPELSAAVADGQYTIQKALAQGNTINGGAPPDGGVGPVTFAENDNWDPQANGIGDPATFTPTFTVAASGGTHTHCTRLHWTPTTWGCAAASTSGSCPANTVAGDAAAQQVARRPASPSTARNPTPRRR